MACARDCIESCSRSLFVLRTLNMEKESCLIACNSQRMPFIWSEMISDTPPALYAITGVPLDIDSRIARG